MNAMGLFKIIFYFTVKIVDIDISFHFYGIHRSMNTMGLFKITFYFPVKIVDIDIWFQII